MNLLGISVLHYNNHWGLGWSLWHY